MTKITLPQAGQSMEEGTILCWRKNEGDQVRKGEILLEIETDKADIEIEAAESGVLRKILCPAGATVPVLTPIAILADASDDLAAEVARAEAELHPAAGGGSAATTTPQAVSGAKPAPAEALSQPQGELRGDEPLPVRASPAARKTARERSVDLGGVWPGSGPGGRVLSTDVLRAAGPGQPVRRPISAMRKAIARSLCASKQTIPHFYMRLTIDAAPLQAFYRACKAEYPCSINDLLISACARVIREFPAFRTRIEGDELVEYPDVNVGVAVGMEDGLRVPVLLRADSMPLREVAAESRRIVEAALQGKVEAMGRGSFTISNLGMYGVEEFAAIINPPEAALLAVGAIRESVTVKDGAMRAGQVMTVTLSADHRIVDGLLAARFLNRLREVLEAPELLGR